MSTSRYPAQADLLAFGRELRQATKAAGMTQTAIGDRIGVTQSAVNYWMHGVSTPRDFRNVFLLEEILGTSRGTLSRHLGLVPLEAASGGAPLHFLEAVDADENLREGQKQLLKDAYALFTATS